MKITIITSWSLQFTSIAAVEILSLSSSLFKGGWAWVAMATGGKCVCVCVLPAGNLNELVQHGLCALRETLPAEQDLTTKVSHTNFSYTHAHAHKSCKYKTCCSDTVYVYPCFRTCPLGLWGKIWSSPSMMTTMWLRFWRD